MSRTAMNLWVTALVVLGMAFCCGMAAAQDEDICGWGLHKRVFAVPAPKHIVINGKLDGWDLSAAVDTFVTLSAKETISGRLAIMYDANALYLGADVRDPTPMMNRHSPEADGEMAWDADSLQFRFCADASAGYPLEETTYGIMEKKDSELQPPDQAYAALVLHGPPGAKPAVPGEHEIPSRGRHREICRRAAGEIPGRLCHACG